MKKYVALIAVFLLLCLLCSCEIYLTRDFQYTLNCAGGPESYIYQGREYIYSSAIYDNYSFYRLSDEKLIGHFPISYLFWTFYEVNNPDFGIVLRDHFMGLDRSAFCFLPHYCLPKDTKMPDIKTVELDKVIMTKSMDEQYIKSREPSNFDGNDPYFIVINNDERYKDKSSSTFSDILDFSNTIPRENIASLTGGASWAKDDGRDYDYYLWGSLFATLKDYESFFCGPLLVIEYNDRLYAEIESTTDDSAEYVAVRDEYQELFENVLAERSD